MTAWRRWSWVLLLALVLVSRAAAAAAPQRTATVREYKKVFRTYPYSDPNPIATPGRIYPYYRFEGYTDRPVDKEWTVVELENDYIKVMVLPEIGGKIWTAIEKSSNRPFIYYNRVVKFRDIALRGPWTSGGIEPNYGIIGHTPNCATPVDYVVRTHPDGSVSVVIGALDLLTRTPWRLEIALPADKAYFTTRSFWHNATPIEQPYYTWMNAGIKAAGNLQLVYPGTHYIGHGGEVSAWPIHPANGKNLSFYEQNDFGPYKSYHVIGRHADFFGAYWHDDDFGMGRYARRDDKLGKKAWIWGLSRQGMIWAKLLTDEDGQYVEVQSGRLFNQAAEGSTFTPFKHRGFAPYSTDTWTEYWFPVKGTKGFVKANDYGVLNVQRDGARVTLWFQPLQAVSNTIEVLDGARLVLSAKVALRPMQAWVQALEAVPAERLVVRIGGTRFEYRAAPEDDVLSRPIEAPSSFDWESAYGLHLKGKELIRQRDYAQAEVALEQCLGKDRHYVPALADLAMVKLRAGEDQAAWDLARRALSIDTYDPAANYYYALASLGLGQVTDAMDGFEVAASSPDFRSAAWTGLARIYLRRGQLADAVEYATRSLEGNAMNLEGHAVVAVAERLQGRKDRAASRLDAILALDPLNHFARFERHLLAGDDKSRRELIAGIRNEMPQETFLELAAWYHGLARLQETRRVLESAPAAAAEVLYWLAYVQHAQQDESWRDTLVRADAASPRLVFPFRAESANVLSWAIGKSASWRPRYYLALVAAGRNDLAKARELLEGCGDDPDYAPFYAARARLYDATGRDRAFADLMRAATLDPVEWRYGRLLTERCLEDRAYDKALETSKRYYAALPDSYILGMLYARSLLLTGHHQEASDLLGRLNVLPYEGATEGRHLHRESQLMLALSDLKAGRPDAALARVAAAREWPEHLGAGKPYPADVDDRLEDWLEAQVLERAGKGSEARALVDRLAGSGAAKPGFGKLIAALALKAAGRPADAERVVGEWAAREADVRIAEWGRRLVAGAQPAWPAGATGTGEHRVLAAWAALS
jgi:tetratricopeptide (TPR) repeat protein